MPTLLAANALLTVVLVAFPFTAEAEVPAVITLMLLGGAGFRTVPAFMTRAIDKAKGAPTLASAVASSGANLGISIGAYLGGLTIDAGLGYTSPSWVGAGMALLAVAVTAWSGMLDNRAGRTFTEQVPTGDRAATRS